MPSAAMTEAARSTGAERSTAIAHSSLVIKTAATALSSGVVCRVLRKFPRLRLRGRGERGRRQGVVALNRRTGTAPGQPRTRQCPMMSSSCSAPASSWLLVAGLLKQLARRLVLRVGDVGSQDGNVLRDTLDRGLGDGARCIELCCLALPPLQLVLRRLPRLGLRGHGELALLPPVDGGGCACARGTHGARCRAGAARGYGVTPAALTWSALGACARGARGEGCRGGRVACGRGGVALTARALAAPGTCARDARGVGRRGGRAARHGVTLATRYDARLLGGIAADAVPR